MRGDELNNRLKVILVEEAGRALRKDDIHDSVPLHGMGIGLDSQGIVSLMTRLENEFSVFFESDEIVAGFGTFGELRQVVRKKLQQEQNR